MILYGSITLFLFLLMPDTPFRKYRKDNFNAFLSNILFNLTKLRIAGI